MPPIDFTRSTISAVVNQVPHLDNAGIIIQAIDTIVSSARSFNSVCEMVKDRVERTQDILIKAQLPGEEYKQKYEYYTEVLKNVEECLRKISKPSKGWRHFMKYLLAFKALEELDEHCSKLDQALNEFQLKIVIETNVAVNTILRCLISPDERQKFIKEEPLSSKEKSELMIALKELSEYEPPVKRGHNKQVQKMRYQTSTIVAVKNFIIPASSENNEVFQKFLRHIRVAKLLAKNSNFIKINGIVEINGYFHTVSEWCDHGDLESFLKTSTLDWSERIRIASEIAGALADMHHNNIYHKDIRSKNVLLDNKKSVKLSGFTESRAREASSFNHVRHLGELFRWRAPEKLEDNSVPYTVKCDVYSFGIVLWEIASHKLPYEGVVAMKVPDLVKKGERPNVEEFNIQPGYKDIMCDAWTQKADKRPNMKEIFERFQKLQCEI